MRGKINTQPEISAGWRIRNVRPLAASAEPGPGETPRGKNSVRSRGVRSEEENKTKIPIPLFAKNAHIRDDSKDKETAYRWQDAGRALGTVNREPEDINTRAPSGLHFYLTPHALLLTPYSSRLTNHPTPRTWWAISK